MDHDQRKRMKPQEPTGQRRGSSRWPARLNRYLTAALTAFFTLIAIVSYSLPVHAADNPVTTFTAGVWRGDFLFNFNHSWDASQPKLVNTYSLQSEIILGTVIFEIGPEGGVTRSRIKIPQFSYTVRAVLMDTRDPDNPCKGYYSYGGGIGTVTLNVSDSTAPSLVPDSITVPSVKITPGSTWGTLTVIGDCSGQPPASSVDQAIQADFNLAASTWIFTATAIYENWMAGSCKMEIWTTANRSLNCWWSAFRRD